MSWIRVTPASSIPLREGRAVQIGAVSVAIFHTDSGFLAVENRCPHRDGPLADGIIGGSTVTCPLHNWRVCLESGDVVKPCDTSAPSARTFPVKVENGVVLIAAESLKEIAVWSAA